MVGGSVGEAIGREIHMSHILSLCHFNYLHKVFIYIVIERVVLVVTLSTLILISADGTVF